MALRADVGQPCPNGCTSGYGRDKQPVLIERACDSPGMRDTPEELADFEDDGERWCPQCWDYMGNTIKETRS